ncbi:MAG: hypothetical protein E8D41_02075 [Nitrospira sp.]|nr:MAG: hypothetical protein E8D41_02075 [Nitrospira sp.]
MRSRAIQDHGRHYSIRLMHRALRHPGDLSRARETYGSPSIWDALVKQRHHIGERPVALLMRQHGIRAKTVKKWRPPNQSQYRFLVAENTLDRPVRIESPNRVWAGSLTYVWPTSPSCSICTRAS